MGIPLYFSQLKHLYPSIHKKPIAIHCLYLDANSIVHPISHREIEQYLTTHDVTANPSSHTHKVESAIIESTLRYIQKIIDKVHPSELVYIALDGVAPRAKMEQQRKRRYKTVSEQKTKQTIYEKYNHPLQYQSLIWDSNCITPGTEFMNRLSSRLHEYAQSFHPHTIVSDSNEMGEGEHKIFQYIKKKNKFDEKVHAVYGLDADLFMLSLSCFPQTDCLYLIRDSMNDHHDEWIYVSIYELASKIVQEVGVEFSSKYIEDYIISCFFIGNDFLPCQESIFLQDHGLHRLLDSLRITYQKFPGQNFLTGKHNWNIIFLKAFFGELEKDEDVCVLRKYKKIVHFHKRPVFDECRQELENINKITDRKKEYQIIRQEKAWKEILYCSEMGFRNNADLDECCTCFLQGLQWMVQYYFHECISWTWFYKYPYAPSFADLYCHVEEVGPEQWNVAVDKTVFTPYQQLLIVLPVASHHLLPSTIRTSIRNSCLQIYYSPTTTTTTTYAYSVGRRFQWEVSPKLPPLSKEQMDFVRECVM